MEIFAVLKMLAALGIVVALMYGFGLFLRKTGLGTAPIGEKKKEKRLKMLEFLPLDSKRRLVLVSCDGKEYLLLAGPNSETVVDSDLGSIARKGESEDTPKKTKTQNAKRKTASKSGKKSGAKSAKA